MPPEPHPGWSLDDWLRYQEVLHPRTIELGLERVVRVADRLELRLRPPVTLTVGGTNGKGSTTTLLASIYREAGYRVGAYTSPHLYRYNERIAIDGTPVDDRSLCRAFAAVEAVRQDDSLSYFEFGTLAALWLFREAQVQVQVLEVGLGGRLDAVNLLDADVAVITNIGLDHRDWLGEDRDAIGREKAGISRAGRPVIVGDADPPLGLLAALEQTGAQVLRSDRGDFRHDSTGSTWNWRCRGTEWLGLPRPGLPGAHQLDNAAGALTAVDMLRSRLPVPDRAIRAALPKLRLPGRMERRGRFLLDVAHNAEAAEVLASWLASEFPGQRLPWIAGMLSDKPAEQIAEALRGVIGPVFTIDLPPPRGMTAGLLASRLRSVGLAVSACEDAAGALAAVGALPTEPSLPILVCGSFLTIAAVEPLL